MVQNEPSVKNPSRITVGVSLPASVYEKLKAAAISEKRTMSNKVMQIVVDYFAET